MWGRVVGGGKPAGHVDGYNKTDIVPGFCMKNDYLCSK